MTTSIADLLTKTSGVHRECSCEMILIDFEWRFAVSSLHSTLPKTSSTFIQLKLILKDSCKQDGKRVEQIQMDISEFKRFYKQIQTIHNMLSIMR